MKKKLIKISSFILSVFILGLILGINFHTSYAQDTSAGEQAVNDLQNISNTSHGIVGDCADLSSSNTSCSPKDAISLVTRLVRAFVYITIIVLVIVLVISGVLYAWSPNDKKPSLLIKIKKYIKNSVVALVIIMLTFTVIFALLEALGFNKTLLDFLKLIFA